ncbi:MAG: cation-transporting P-type ATPase [Proteobacteria bacterium]|nr:MAG: cation-transporting P-type ATPase [Pseudomonadota bacterium]
MAIDTEIDNPNNWHTLSAQNALAGVDSSTEGLCDTQVAERRRRYGFNRLRPPKKSGPLARFLFQFHNVLIYVLLAAAAMTAFLAHWVDTGVILAVVVLNALIGFIQEGKAEKALDAIRGMLSQQASVRRNGHQTLVDAAELVPGDIVFVQSGDKVPADLRLIHTRELQIEEAMLTGESVPAEKSTAAVAEDAPLGDREGMVYSGTLVTYGQGTGVVVAIGDATEIGRISTLLRDVQTLTTPLLRKMAGFARWLTGAILVIAALTFFFGIWVRDYSTTEMFLAGVGLAVAAIPEGLPAIMTITLAIGVQRMARRNAIIRRLPAVETLGAVTTICSDKTGTLTRNEMTATAVVTATGMFEVNGSGYDPHGCFVLDNREVELSDYPILRELARASALCNDARLSQRDGQWLLEGDPTEGALLTLGMKAGLDLDFQQEEWPRTDIIPFESQHRFMATLHHDHAGHGFAYVKGAPERLLEMCDHQRMRGEDLPLDLTYWHVQMNRMAQKGQRLLAIAWKATMDDRRALAFGDVETGLTLIGLVGIMDPPREEAIQAVRLCQSAGIQVKMITGDHAVTATAIGLQMGIGDGTRVVTGPELDAMDDSTLRDAVLGTDVFARTSPEHKLRLVQALQAADQVVAMTGDGVNDAPALKRADVGIAMGRKGTEVAKEAAEMVLADDNFASIAHAVEEGRTVFDNLKKAIIFILPTNGGEALAVIAAILFGMQLPITPVQILWVNMITAVTLALALAFEPAEARVMARPPRDPGEPLLSRLLVWRIVFVSLILVTGTFGLFVWDITRGGELAHARTVAVNTLVMYEIFYLFNSRYLTASVLNRNGLVGNRWALVAIGVLLVFQLAFTYFGPLQKLFDTRALEAQQWGIIILVASSVLFLVEIEKALIRKRNAPSTPHRPTPGHL